MHVGYEFGNAFDDITCVAAADFQRQAPQLTVHDQRGLQTYASRFHHDGTALAFCFRGPLRNGASLFVGETAFRVDDALEHVKLRALTGIVILRIQRTHVVGEDMRGHATSLESAEPLGLVKKQQQHCGDMLAHARIAAPPSRLRIELVIVLHMTERRS